MTSLTLTLLLHMSLASGGTDSYAEAHRVTTETGKPMLVMVSAEWCDSCRTMEKTVLPKIEKHGLLQKVSFAVVNFDRERALANKLIGNGPLPQLVMYRKNGNGWLRRKLVGGHSAEAVEKFIEQGIARDEAAKKAEQQQQQQQASQKPAGESKVASNPEAQPTQTR
jgi:thioredoxin-like negative regulator of GroEL